MISPLSGRVNTLSIAPVSTEESTGSKKPNFMLQTRIIIPTAIVVCAIAISVILCVFLLKPTNIIDDDSNDRTTTSPLGSFPTIERNEWNASPPKIGIKELTTPIKRIIVAHTADKDELCNNFEECKIRVKAIQDNNAHLMDIPYNFLIGADGNVYEGRGYFYEGEHTANLNASSYNDIGICIAFIGVFQFQKPTQAQINAFEMFVEHNVNDGMIVQDYKLFFQDQLTAPKMNADALLSVLENWKNFYSIVKIYRREEWGAYSRCRESPKFSLPLDRTVFTHTVTPLCFDINGCGTRIRNLQYGAQGNCPVTSSNDINFGFMIGGDGLILEGRGFDEYGAHTSGLDYNAISLGIAFIGNFNNDIPNQAMIDTTLKFLDDAMALGKFSEDYKIYARIDLGSGLAGPGNEFYKIMQLWPRFTKIW